MKLVVILFFTCIAYSTFAQNQPSIFIRLVSGIVKDATGEGLGKATVRLIGSNDTLRTSTDSDGVFVFDKVNNSSFLINVQKDNYPIYNGKYFFNEKTENIVINPIVLNGNSKILKEVIINGSPTITYKTDTVEYRASDYKVPLNATVDELLKRMEGMDVDIDGSLSYKGQKVERAKLNGRDYNSNVAEAIHSLPADIVERIQIVDDYGDEANRTGIKDGDPTKILNIRTKPEKSIGLFSTLNGAAGNNDRYESKFFLQRLNNNKLLGLTASANNTVNGVNATNSNSSNYGPLNTVIQNSSLGNGGTTSLKTLSLNYRDELSKKISLNFTYSFNHTLVNSTNSSEGQIFSNSGTTFISSQTSDKNTILTHLGKIELENQLSKNDYVKYTQKINFKNENDINESNVIENGLVNQKLNGNSILKRNHPITDADLLYQHLFQNRNRELSLHGSVTTDQFDRNNQQSTILNFLSADNNQLQKDSLLDLITLNKNGRFKFGVYITYTEPISKFSKLELSSQYENSFFNNLTSSLNSSIPEHYKSIDSLASEFNYTFNEFRFTAAYRVISAQYSLSLGVSSISSIFKGPLASSPNKNFYLAPVIRVQHTWQNTKRVFLNYTGFSTLPSYLQLKPTADYSDPQNVVFGNPNLRTGFVHSINTGYDNYVPNARVNLSINLIGAYYNNQSVLNVFQIENSLHELTNRTYFKNESGAYSLTAFYNVSKQSFNRKINYELDGIVNHSNLLSYSNDQRSLMSLWRFTEKFGLRVFPYEFIEINPFISYDHSTSQNNLADAVSTKYDILSLNLEGKITALKSYRLGYFVSKKIISGISPSVNRSPFVVNSFIEKEILKHQSLIFGFQGFDIFNQNRFVNRVISPNGFSDTQSNALSRYFMFSVKYIFQKWSSNANVEKQLLRRRGDGSFY